jgi:hypothetical protein
VDDDGTAVRVAAGRAREGATVGEGTRVRREIRRIGRHGGTYATVLGGGESGLRSRIDGGSATLATVETGGKARVTR